ncbi:MAG: polyketide cyclase, partial [Aeromicrobium sp.]|nr:polyketide cyclase [Aeromicrobium sp.]
MTTATITAEPSTQQITITRDLDAPVALVYRAFTEPDLLAQWMGPDR